MTEQSSTGMAPGGESVAGWPASLAGVTETVIATRGPNGRWNQAALGITPPADGQSEIERGSDRPAAARTFGNTRTRRNLAAGREAYVQFTRDPVDFVEAALAVYETDEPILASADAWVRIEATARSRGEDRSTEVVEWSLGPIESGIRERTVPTENRGRAAAIEATVPASRLDVEGYDETGLLQRLEWLADVVEAAGDDRARVAFERIDERVGWRDRTE